MIWTKRIGHSMVNGVRIRAAMPRIAARSSVTALLLSVLLLLPAVTPAQESKSGAKFNPVIYMSMIRIYRQYGEGKFIPAPGTTRSFTDTLRSGRQLLGFSILDAAQETPGWKLWLDFEADRYFRQRLVRCLAQMQSSDAAQEMKDYRVWVETVLVKRIGEREEIENGFRWQWTAKTGYYLSLRSSVDRESGLTYIVLKLDIDS